MRSRAHIQFGTVFLLNHIFLLEAQYCVFVQNDDFKNCSSSVKRDDLEKCKKDEFCKETLKVTKFEKQLYSDEISDQITRMLSGCCGQCGQIEMTNSFTELGQLNKSNFRSSDIIYPIIGKRSSRQIYGFHYVPVYDVPSAYFFTKPESDKESMGKLIHACLNMWPLILTCLLLAFVSGFVVWFLERKKNRGEFPKEFHLGLSEGFWWSFVSMTTVGYGDKTPKTFVARIFAVVWILVGITIFALLTGSLTNKINAINEYKEPTLYGKRIGGLQSRLHEATLVAHHGGVFIEYSYTDTMSGIVNLMKAVDGGNIDGFIISRPTFYNFHEQLKSNNYYDSIVKNMPLDRCEKKYLGNDELTVGLLFRDSKKFNYFKYFFEDNWLQIKGCLEFQINQEVRHMSEDTSKSHFKGDFHTVLYVTLVLIGLIVLYGFLQMVFKRFGYNPCKSKNTNGKFDREGASVI